MEGKKEEYPRVRFQGYEHEAMNALMATLTLTKMLEPLKKRAKQFPMGVQTISYLQKRSDWLLEELLRTMPFEQIETAKQNLSHVRFNVGIKNSFSDADRKYGRWFSSRDVSLILQLSAEHCAMCDFDNTEQLKCPYRKMFDALPVDIPEHAKGCPYFIIWGIEAISIRGVNNNGLSVNKARSKGKSC